jgi:hypothetical protein
MTEYQGETQTQMEFQVSQPEQPRCQCCQAPAFGENVIDTGQLCLKHTELRIYIWRLRKRGDPVSLASLIEYMHQVKRPVSFAVSELKDLYHQYVQAGLLETGGLR